MSKPQNTYKMFCVTKEWHQSTYVYFLVKNAIIHLAFFPCGETFNTVKVFGIQALKVVWSLTKLLHLSSWISDIWQRYNWEKTYAFGFFLWGIPVSLSMNVFQASVKASESLLVQKAAIFAESSADSLSVGSLVCCDWDTHAHIFWPFPTFLLNCVSSGATL